jgi:hypothetical protein
MNTSRHSLLEKRRGNSAGSLVEGGMLLTFTEGKIGEADKQRGKSMAGEEGVKK